MKRSRIQDGDDVNLDDLDAGSPRGATGADTGPDDDADDDPDDELPDGDEDPDDDAADDEGDDADDEGDEDPDDAAAAGVDDGTRGEPRRGRANDTIRSLRASARAARQEARDLKTRFDDFIARGNQTARQPTATQETQEQRTARRALLSAEERMSEDMSELRQLVVTTNHQTQLTTADATDRASYDAKATSDQLYRRWSGKVETERARLAGLGQFVAREAILTFLLGKAALEARSAGASKGQKAQAGRRVARQTVKPGDSRSDATQSRRGSQSTLEKRLEDVPL
jgi:hypothetical protein